MVRENKTRILRNLFNSFYPFYPRFIELIIIFLENIDSSIHNCVTCLYFCLIYCSASHSGFCSFFLVQGLTFGSAGCQVANPPRPSPAPRHKGGEDASGCAVPRFCRLLWGGLLLSPGFAVRHRRASGTSIRQNPSFAPRHGVFGSFRPFGVFVLFFASPVCVIPPLCGYLCSAVS